MLENVNLKRKLSRKEYNRDISRLQRRLYDLEKACWDHKVPSMIAVEGWDASGKGGAIATLTQRLDPRGFKVHSIQLPRTFEQNRPWLWRFWLRVPNCGEMVIFDQSWYSRILIERVENLIPEMAWRAAYRDILDFERMLSDDGTVILKFFLHITKKEQERRFLKIASQPLEAWRVDKDDWARHRKYDQYVVATDEMLELTESEYAPWTIVEATSRRWAKRKIFQAIIAALEHRLGRNAPSRDTSDESAAIDADLRTAMHSLDPSEGNY